MGRFCIGFGGGCTGLYSCQSKSNAHLEPAPFTVCGLCLDFQHNTSRCSDLPSHFLGLCNLTLQPLEIHLEIHGPRLGTAAAFRLQRQRQSPRGPQGPPFFPL